MFNLAEVWGWRQDRSNPVRHIEKYKEERRERFLSGEEFVRLGEALTNAATEETESPHLIAAIRLLLLTGARLSEILTLRWDQVDFPQRLLKLSDSKTGAKTIWLNPPALEILTAVPRIKGNPFVIAGGRNGARLVNIHKPWARICARAGLSDLRIHDLRHSYASVAVNAGIGLYLTGTLLGHLRNTTTERYAHLADDPIRNANELVGKHIAHVMGRL